MEEIIKQLLSDVSSTKHTSIKHTCKEALDLLANKDEMSKTPTHLLREKCLEPFQLAMECKSKKLGLSAVHGIQKMLEDERFRSGMETESEEYWMPVQVLNTVFCTPTLSEEVQVEVMKLLLNMTFSASWCMTSGVITKVAQVYIDTFMTSSHSVKGAVLAALTQVLSSFTDKFKPEKGGEEQTSVMDDFNSQEHGLSDASFKEIVGVLKFFTSKLEQTSSSNSQIKQAAPLLLEAIHTILSKVPGDIRSYLPFQEILWKSLCPSLISLLGNPKMEKSTSSPKHSTTPLEGVGRGSGCSTSAPNLQISTAKTIYSIALSLVDLMGRTESMRPVLESVFHRMILYPPPQHRLDALKAVRELLKTPAGIFGLALPTEDINRKSVTKNPYTDVSLIKMIVDSIEESCHCNETMVCITSVACINDMLGSLEQISRGVNVTDEICQSVNKLFTLLDEEDKTRTDRRVSLAEDGDILKTIGDDELEIRRRNSHSPHRRQTVEQQIILQEEVERRYTKFGSQYEVTERQNARMYIDELSKVLPQMTEMYSVQDVDEGIQKFASNFCTKMLQNPTEQDGVPGQMTVLNADSVYTVTMTTLLLNLKLSRDRYYEEKNKDKISITEKDFLDDILGCGLMLFVSPAWLSEVYSQIISHDLLKSCGCLNQSDSPLLSIIKDIDGLGNHDKGGQLLTEIQKYETTSEPSSENIQHIEMGKKFSRRLLSRCWDSILDVLSVLLNGKNSCGITSSIALLLGTEGAKEESFREREAICRSLEGLQKAARLCCVLGMPQRCGNVFSHLATTSCVILHTPKSPLLERKLPGKPVVNTKPKPVRLHASHVLSMDVMMTIGLEMGGHSPDCWKHLFRCTAFISELEHTYFSQGNNQSNLPKLQHEQPTVDTGNDDDLYGVPVTAATPVAPRINIPDLINQSKIESAWERSRTGGGVLNAAQASQALCGLSQQVDRLFEAAAEKLNMSALLDFLSKLCESSQDQLNKMILDEEEEEELMEQPQLPQNALHLYRLQEVLMKIVNSNRPLLHLMRVWSVVSGFLVEAAGHRVRNVSKMAVTCVHDFIQAMISNHQELPHYHINEFLCKTFENMLCLELCDGDVQDQIVCSVCELVEACTADLKSGWRPLFGALRAVKIEQSPDEEINEIRQRHVAAVLDVFEVFLNTDNIFVFANATVDCILCLLKYVRGPGQVGEYDSDDDDDSDSGSDFTIITQGESLCIPALGYLKKCNNILQTMWKMPACPVFNGAHRINSHTSNLFVDSTLPNIDMEDFKQQFTQNPNSEEIGKGFNPNVNKDLLKLQEEEERLNDCTSLDSVDSGITLNSENQQGESQSCPVNTKQGESQSCLVNTKQGESQSCPVNTKQGESQSCTVNTKHNKEKEEDKIEPESQICFNGDFDEIRDQLKEPVPANQNSLSESPDSGTANENSVITPANIPSKQITDQTQANIEDNPDSPTLESLDNESGILHVWFLMIDGLAGSVACCPKTYQPETLDMLFDLLKSLHNVPGPFFSYYCVNHLLLPMLQTWLRSGVRKAGYWDTGATNFKQCCGLTADLVVDFIVTHKEKEEADKSLKELMLKQLLDILTECVAQPVEVISRLGCSCIRHVFLSAGGSFTEEMWQICAMAMEKALDVTTYYLQQLMHLFSVNSENFYGDLGQVKVAMRKDSTPAECERLRHLAQQVFLLDTQVKKDVDIETESEADKSFVFLLYRPGDENSLNPDDIVTRIPFRNIVIGLLSNQLLLQTVGSILLSTEHVSGLKANEGLLGNLSVRNIIKFLQCLRQSYKLAAEFDTRPGLKFLIQKVARTEVAVNLYKQAGASMIFYLHTLLQICVSIPDLSNNHVKCITVAQQFIKDVNKLESEYMINVSKMESCPMLFLQLLRSVCDELCHTYVEILSDETSARVDQMSEQQVFFIIAQPDDFSSNFVKSKKKSSRSESETSQECIMTTKDVPLQEVYQHTDVFTDNNKDDHSDTASVTSKRSVMKSKREIREEQESKVYTLATDTLIKSLMTEYKKHKKHHAMPTFVKISKEKKLKPILKKTDSVDESIAKQRKSSIMKDSEARIQSWTELLCSTLGLFQQQPDTKFRLLQPAVFYCVNQLVCHAEDRRLREALGQWVHRIGIMIDCIT